MLDIPAGNRSRHHRDEQRQLVGSLHHNVYVLCRTFRWRSYCGKLGKRFSYQTLQGGSNACGYPVHCMHLRSWYVCVVLLGINPKHLAFACRTELRIPAALGCVRDHALSCDQHSLSGVHEFKERRCSSQGRDYLSLRASDCYLGA